jgi:hypothetical protein
MGHRGGRNKGRKDEGQREGEKTVSRGHRAWGIGWRRFEDGKRIGYFTQVFVIGWKFNITLYQTEFL